MSNVSETALRDFVDITVFLILGALLSAGARMFLTPERIAELGSQHAMLAILRQMGIPVVEQAMPRELLYICDEAFFTGTAAEVTHLRSVDRIMVGDGTMGPITSALHKAFFEIVHGLAPDRYNWLTPVKVGTAESMEEPVTA